MWPSSYNSMQDAFNITAESLIFALNHPILLPNLFVHLLYQKIPTNFYHFFDGFLLVMNHVLI